MDLNNDDALLGLLENLHALGKTETSHLRIRFRRESLSQDQLFELAMSGGEVLANLDRRGGLALFDTTTRTRTRLRRGLVTRQEAMHGILDCLASVNFTFLRKHKHAPEPIAKLAHIASRWLVQWSRRKTESETELQQICSLIESVCAILYPSLGPVDLAHHGRQLYSIKRTMDDLQKSFRLTYQRKENRLRIAFIPASESETLRQIGLECEQLILSGEPVHRSWLLSLWERTRQFNSPTLHWMEKWHRCIVEAGVEHGLLVQAQAMPAKVGIGNRISQRSVSALLAHLKRFRAGPMGFD